MWHLFVHQPIHVKNNPKHAWCSKACHPHTLSHTGLFWITQYVVPVNKRNSFLLLWKWTLWYKKRGKGTADCTHLTPLQYSNQCNFFWEMSLWLHLGNRFFCTSHIVDSRWQCCLWNVLGCCSTYDTDRQWVALRELPRQLNSSNSSPAIANLKYPIGLNWVQPQWL